MPALAESFDVVDAVRALAEKVAELEARVKVLESERTAKPKGGVR